MGEKDRPDELQDTDREQDSRDVEDDRHCAVDEGRDRRPPSEMRTCPSIPMSGVNSSSGNHHQAYPMRENRKSDNRNRKASSILSSVFIG